MSLDLKVMEELEEKAPEINTAMSFPSNLEGLAIQKWFLRHRRLFLSRITRSKRPATRTWSLCLGPSIVKMSSKKYLNSPRNGIITDEVQLVKDFKDDFKKNNTLMDPVLRALGITLVFSKSTTKKSLCGFPQRPLLYFKADDFIQFFFVTPPMYGTSASGIVTHRLHFGNFQEYSNCTANCKSWSI